MRTITIALAISPWTDPVASVLDQSQLQELYRAPVERLTDAQSGAVVFLPG
jgi:hypothetical protein